MENLVEKGFLWLKWQGSVLRNLTVNDVVRLGEQIVYGCPEVFPRFFIERTLPTDQPIVDMVKARVSKNKT